MERFFNYDTLRAFADSWGLLFLMLFFIGVVLFVFRPGGRKAAERAAQIPLKDD